MQEEPMLQFFAYDHLPCQHIWQRLVSLSVIWQSQL